MSRDNKMYQAREFLKNVHLDNTRTRREEEVALKKEQRRQRAARQVAERKAAKSNKPIGSLFKDRPEAAIGEAFQYNKHPENTLGIINKIRQ